MRENAEQATLSDAERDLMMTTLGTRLRKSRKARGLTQRALAQRAGVSVKHISDVERGRKLPSLVTLVTLADELKASVDDWLGMLEFEALRDNRPDLAKFLATLREDVAPELLPFVEDLVDLMDRHGLLVDEGLADEGRLPASASRSRQARRGRGRPVRAGSGRARKG